MTHISTFTGAVRTSPLDLIRNSRRGVLSLVLTLLAWGVMASSAGAQNIQFTQGGVGSGQDNGLEIPLRTYPGRGAASLPVTLYYSSRVWRLGQLGTINNNVWFKYQTITEAIYAEHSTAGWKTSLDIPIVEWPKNEDTFYYTGKPFCQVCGSSFREFRVARVYIHMADGSRHELRKSDQPYEGPIDMYGTFYAVDGSRLRYDSTGQSTGTIYFPDGTRYVLSPSSAQYIDRNGNTLNYDTPTRRWTDTLGREINIPLPSNPSVGEQVYTLPGMPLPYKFIWKHLSDSGVLTPVAGQVPQRKPIANEYLPNPAQPPTPPSGNNFPITLQTSYSERPSLFISAFDDDAPDDPATIVVGRSQTGGELFDPVVLTEIVFPNDLRYKFSYNVYGEIDKITYPTGGFDSYDFAEIPPLGDVKPPYLQANRGITARRLSANGTGNDLASWTYSSTGTNVTITAPDLAQTQIHKTNYPTPIHSGTQGSISRYWPFGFEDARQGTVFEESVSAPVSQGGAMLRRKLIDWSQTASTVQPSIPELDNTTKTAYRSAHSIKEVSLILDTGGDALAKTLTYAYDTTYELSTGLDLTGSTESFFANVNQATAQTGAIATIPSGPLAGSVETIYLDDAAYRDLNLLGLRTSIVLKDANGLPVSKTETLYDESAYPLLPYGDLIGDPNYIDPGLTTPRTNATTVRRYIDISANLYLETHGQFDQCGNARKVWNERGIESQVEYSAAYKRAYATQATTAVPDASGAHGSNAAFTASTTFDYTIGVALTTIDANGQTTTFSYKNDQDVTDPLNRLRKVTRPDGGWTKFGFNDVVGNLFSSTETKLDDTRISVAYKYVDPLGRSSRSFMSEGGANYIATDTLHDNVGQAWKKSSIPYRTTQRDGIAAESHTSHWTTSHYDALGRVDSITLPDSSIIQTKYEGTYTTVTDPAGKKRRQKVDALGRIVRVDEPDAGGNLGTFDEPVQASHYDYNTQGSVIHIAQGASTQQHRYFKYDGLGRLTHERQVEQAGTFTVSDPLTANSSWSRKLIYDETLFGVSYKGMLTSAYDARNILTQYQFDNLNRLVTISYSDGVTPMVTNFYDSVRFTVPSDARPVHNLGRLAEVQTAALGSVPSTRQAYNYDLMGRAMQNRQTVDTNVYTMGYAYSVGGALTSQTYPSGRVVNYDFDDAARLAEVSSGATSYASQFNYGSQGLLASVALGNGAVESFAFNSRLQLESIDLTKSGTQLQHYDYKYGVYDPGTNTLDEAKNNGQLAQIEGFIGAQKQWQQRFAYDNLGRLKSAREHRGDNNQQSYLLNYDYDLFGNRYQYQGSNASNPFSQSWVEAGQISQATNRYNSNVIYDDAGNILEDAKFHNLEFEYDANNRQRSAANLDGSGAVTAVFDGAGQRLATMSNGVITNISVYDAMGMLVAEYGEGGTTNGTQYLLSDHQGSPRVATSSAGTVISRHDYLPFGEEIGDGVGMRTAGQFYGAADGVKQKYAGMEKGDAPGMAHTLWRKYDSLSGRWTTTDPYGGSMSLADPQSFNRYTYVNNDPVNQVDPSGLMVGADQGWGSVEAGFWGSYFDPNLPHFGGPAAYAEAVAQHDRWMDIDAAGGDYGDDAIPDPEETEDTGDTADPEGPADPSDGEVTVTAEVTGPAEEAAQQTETATACRDAALTKLASELGAKEEDMPSDSSKAVSLVAGGASGAGTGGRVLGPGGAVLGGMIGVAVGGMKNNAKEANLEAGPVSRFHVASKRCHKIAKLELAGPPSVQASFTQRFVVTKQFGTFALFSYTIRKETLLGGLYVQHGPNPRDPIKTWRGP